MAVKCNREEKMNEEPPPPQMKSEINFAAKVNRNISHLMLSGNTKLIQEIADVLQSAIDLTNTVINAKAVVPNITDEDILLMFNKVGQTINDRQNTGTLLGQKPNDQMIDSKVTGSDVFEYIIGGLIPSLRTRVPQLMQMPNYIPVTGIQGWNTMTPNQQNLIKQLYHVLQCPLVDVVRYPIKPSDFPPQQGMMGNTQGTPDCL